MQQKIDIPVNLVSKCDPKLLSVTVQDMKLEVGVEPGIF